MTNLLLAILVVVTVLSTQPFSSLAFFTDAGIVLKRRNHRLKLHCKSPKLWSSNVNDDNVGDDSLNNRRRNLLSTAAAAFGAVVSAINSPAAAEAAITKDSDWPLWTALPVAPFNRRRTIRYQIGSGLYAFDQLIGIYYVHVPIRMSVMAVHQEDEQKRGLVVYAPVAPTKECLSLMNELIRMHGQVRDIIHPSTAVEHKVNAGPFARAFPEANFYVTDKQYR